MITYSIIKKSQLEGAKRLDAEFYCVSNQIKGDFVLGKNAVEFVQYGTSKELNEERNGFPILRLNEFNEFFIKTPEKYCNKISKEIFDSLSLKKGDVLICRTNGNPKFVGKSAVVLEDAEIAFASYLFRVRPKKEIISPESLATFLNSKIGRTQIERFLMPSIQSNFSPTQFRAIKIPVLPKSVQDEIDTFVRRSYSLGNESNILYSQAENLLLEELGLKNFEAEIRKELWSVVKLSEAKKANRIDAEYFQPKYEHLLSRTRKNSDTELLEDVVSIKRGSLIAPRFYDNANGTPYIRGGDFSSGRFEKTGLVYINNSFLPKNETVVKEGDIVFASIGSVGTLAVVPKEFNGSFISNNTAKISIKDKTNLIPEYLGLLLHSIVGQFQFEKEMSQTAQPKISDFQVKSFRIPILSKPTQQKIAELVRKSHEARKQAKSLLEEAKLKVEQLIESHN